MVRLTKKVGVSPLDPDQKQMQKFYSRKRRYILFVEEKKGERKEGNICRRKTHFFAEEKKSGKGKKRKYIFFAEEKERRKIFGEGIYIFAEEKKKIRKKEKEKNKIFWSRTMSQ